MKNIGKTIFCFLLVLAIAGCGGGGIVSHLYQVETGTVDGYVYAPIGGTNRKTEVPSGYAPLEGAAINVGSRTTLTKSSGYYRLSAVPVGSQTVSISKSGYDTITLKVTVEANEIIIATHEDDTSGLMILSVSGTLDINSDPTDALIFIDSIDTGLTTPRLLTDISTGTHTIHVTLDDYITPTAQIVSVTSGATSTVVFNLEHEMYLCEDDNECVEVQGGCCSCSFGGTSTSINQDYIEYWYSLFDCVDTMCLTVISDDWTCFAEPKCIDNRCQLL